MRQVFKNGGDWKTSEGIKYTANVVNPEEFEMYLANGWVSSVDELEKPKRKTRKTKGTN